VADKLPAVSGSSGHLIVQRSQTETDEREWPGRVFEDPELTYEEAMLDFVVASRERENQQETGGSEAEQTEEGLLKAEKRALRREEAQLRDERRQVREKRKLEDAAWKEARAARKAEEQTRQALSKEERRQQRQAWRARDEQWRALREQRRATLEQREREDEEWREKRRSLRERLSQLPVITAWIAILVIVDNCTRECLGLPLFMAGANVTSEMIVEALRVLLPPELRFLISDRGTHFKANDKGFLIWVKSTRPLPPPEPNGDKTRCILWDKDELPEWCKVDWKTVEEKTIDAPLSRIFEALGWRTDKIVPLTKWM